MATNRPSSVSDNISADADDDTTPLLATHDPDSHRKPNPLAVLLLCGLLTIVADFGGGLTAAPEVRLLEMAICREFYASKNPKVIGPPPFGYVDESLCKLAEIQVSLAYLRAWKRVFDTIPGLLLTVLFGRLADRWGRRPVLLLGMTGQILAYFWLLAVCYFYDVFSPRCIWFGSIFLAMGGGFRVLTAVLNSVIVDVCAEEKRSAVFYTFGAAIHITDIVAPPLGSWFLSQDLWLPYKFSSPLMLLSFVIILLLPETFSRRRKPSPSRAVPQAEEAATRPTVERSTISRISDTISNVLNGARRNGSASWLFVLIFIHSFATQSSPLLLPFVSKHLRWTLAAAGYLLSIKALCAVLVLMVLIPVANFLVCKNADNSRRGGIDIHVCRVSLFLLAVGSLIIGFSATGIVLIPGTILVSFGAAFPQAMQGMLGAAAQSRESTTASLYAGQAVIELAGTLLGSISMAAVFDFGMHFEDISELGLGSPFLASGILFSIALLGSYTPMIAQNINQVRM